VYAIADGSAGRPVLDLVSAFVRGGAAAVQLRLKDVGTGEFIRLARAARGICGGSLFFINDRADIARLVEADGLHLGQDDLPLAEAREIVGPHTIIGISTHSNDEIDAAQAADYIGFGPIFATQSKPGAILPPPHGIEGLRKAVKRSKIPVVAIGGITARTAADVYAAGAHCVAAIAELCKAPDPEAAVRSLR
jgi:thiamine-phosphate pyrophosphorylase